jgi:sugar phosphate isomerase/epimerase
MDRRSFLTALAATAVAASCRGRPSAAVRGFDAIGVQLYTVRDRMAADVAGTLRAVADIGYREVETAGLFDLSAARFRAELDAAGLASPAGHYGIGEVRAQPDAVIDTGAQLGQRWLVVPSLAAAERNADGYRRLADDLNRFGETAARAGRRAAYHNHDFEFAPLAGGGTGFETLLERTDPALVDIELDLFWAVRGGHDPVSLFTAHPGRFALWHVKDMADPDGAQTMVPVGAGGLDFARMFAHAEVAGLRHFFVEHDNPRDSIESIRAGYAHLRGLTS